MESIRKWLFASTIGLMVVVPVGVVSAQKLIDQTIVPQVTDIGTPTPIMTPEVTPTTGAEVDDKDEIGDEVEVDENDQGENEQEVGEDNQNGEHQQLGQGASGAQNNYDSDDQEDGDNN